MAVKSDATSKIILKVTTGRDTEGNEIVKRRTVSHINPALSDDSALSLGTKLAALQSDTLASVSRTDSATLE